MPSKAKFFIFRSAIDGNFLYAHSSTLKLKLSPYILIAGKFMCE